MGTSIIYCISGREAVGRWNVQVLTELHPDRIRRTNIQE